MCRRRAVSTLRRSPACCWCQAISEELREAAAFVLNRLSP